MESTYLYWIPVYEVLESRGLEVVLVHSRQLKNVPERKEEIAEHLTGAWREEHLFNLGSALRLYDTLEREIELYDERILEVLIELQPPERQQENVPAHPNPQKRYDMTTGVTTNCATSCGVLLVLALPGSTAST